MRSLHPHDDAHVVLDEQDRDLLLVAHPVDELDEAADSCGFMPAVGSSSSSTLRPQRQRPGHLEAALVAVGEVAGVLVGRLADADEVEQFAGESRPPAPRGAAAACAGWCRTTPDFRWECIATMTFSSAVIRLNSRMFWNVRAMPTLAILCGGIAGDVRAVQVRPVPSVGL